MKTKFVPLVALSVAVALVGCGGGGNAKGGKVRTVASGNVDVKAGDTVKTQLNFSWDGEGQAPAKLKVKVQIEADKGLTVTPSSFDVELDQGKAEKIVDVEVAKDAKGELSFKATSTPEGGTPTTMTKKFQVK